MDISMADHKYSETIPPFCQLLAALRRMEHYGITIERK